MIDFGDTFRHRENDYVYLGQTEDFVYAARILNSEHTAWLTALEKAKTMNPANRTHESTVYYFTLLSTDEFRGRAAHLHEPAHDTTLSIQSSTRLNNEDIERLKKDILESPSAPKLKALVKERFGE